MKVIHVITKLELGGAQENTLYTVEGLHRSGRHDVTLVTGPAIGPEGDLLDRAKASGVREQLERSRTLFRRVGNTTWLALVDAQ